ncbi:hypothetical protein B0H14DRAFT_57284 [Mycena olivaceomarginata]|nr:hypothetical protein B0H14DRAFT_57284 [Mycena olivaceomarginata]
MRSATSVAGVPLPLTPASSPSREPYPSSVPTPASARKLHLLRTARQQIAPPCNGIPARASSTLHLPLLSGTSTHRERLIHPCGAEPSGRRMHASFEAGRLEPAPLSARLAGGEHLGRGAWCVEPACGCGCARVGAGARKRLVESGHRCVGSTRTIPILVPSAGATSTAPPVSALGASLMIVRPPHCPVLLRVVVVEALRVQ